MDTLNELLKRVRAENRRMDMNVMNNTSGNIHVDNALIKDALTNGASIDNPLKNLQDGIGHLNRVIDIPISSLCDHNGYNYGQMLRHMNMNISQLSFLLAFSGNSTPPNGIGTVITNDAKNDYSYTAYLDYIRNFQFSNDSNERMGINTTSGILNKAGSDANGSYSNINQIYQTSQNLYPDENDSGSWGIEGGGKWNLKSDRSLLYKTKKLFSERKINTLISRFHGENKLAESTTSATSVYGVSHGKNLLTYYAETNDVSYIINGYNNPYCRVWTHHHKYDRLSRLIRPFVIEGESAGSSSVRKDINKWSNFKDHEYKILNKIPTTSSDNNDFLIKDGENVDDNTKDVVVTSDYKKINWGWRAKGADSYKMSVLNSDTGMLNIAPQFKGGGDLNIHTKDCMFSIENLAWQGYDPYSFEQALSWEQRGPFGGRIMWFPPYGLRFNEDTSVNWNEHQFIGRGESVYTYTNTSRSGTLEFMLVVDHPSIIDYATWYREDANTSHKYLSPKDSLTDTDIHRFFAGCEVEGAALKDKAMPTPLTDEYTEQITKELIEETPTPEEPKEETQEEPPSPVPDEEITFYVFFPNNYSGYYDRKDGNIEPMAYLLAGINAQEECLNEDIKTAGTLIISFDTLGGLGVVMGNGYEMSGSGGITNSSQTNNYIYGTENNFSYVKTGNEAYMKGKINNMPKKWYYRIDGCYDVKDGKQNGLEKNCYGQTLKLTNDGQYDLRYKDLKSYGYNFNQSAVKSKMTEEKDNENLVSFAEFAYVIAPNDKVKRVINERALIREDAPRIEKLKKLLSEDSVYTISSVDIKGCSNSHGANTSKVNSNRNDFLADQRAISVGEWLKKYCKNCSNINYGKYDSGVSTNVEKDNESGAYAKLYRNAKVVMKFKRTQTENAANVDEDANMEINDIIDFEPSDGEDTQGEETPQFTNPADAQLYEMMKESQTKEKTVNHVENELVKNEDENGNIWYTFADEKPLRDEETGEPLKNEDGTLKKVKDESVWKEVTDKNGNKMKVKRDVYARYNSKYTENKGIEVKKEDFNHLRYDQEYYFFRQLEIKDKPMYDTLVKKLRFFNPAFHSMTPEGFMGRLTFLQQCTRQGNTISASDKDAKSANNLAFGRPPFCVLRLGDFYYQKIVIKSINISYDPLVWDLNQEGVGVVPMIANVSIQFNFIGGGDLAGPVRRLQNAMSFNYYANTRLYDNRADRVKYKYDDKTNGAIDHSLDVDGSEFYLTKMYEPN